ncbi:MAG: hypothetical protein H6937_06520 [Burkholderiales bacterium]|nr:hypothetical protein [Burkholderiales bacterium]MDR4515991.1 hypothetical protein [Nitrosomonas sp.]
MRTIFTLASGRSGTRYLAYFFKDNVKNCYSTHEPYLTFGNPVLFGKPIAWNTYFEDEKLLPLLQQKSAFIAGVKQPVYFESNHAFLKSCQRYASILVDEPGFIHLVRDPRYVAKSEFIREQLIQRMHTPFAYYKMNGEYYFRWALTGKETIFDYYKGMYISRFQFYLLQWIEIEFRAMRLLEENGWRDCVFFVEVEKDLKNESAMRSMLDFFGLETNRVELNMNHRTNKTPFLGKTALTAEDIEACKQVMSRLPQQYLSMLMQAPYKNCGWTDLFLSSD